MAAGPPVSPDIMQQQMPPMQAFSDQGQQMLNNAPPDAMSADPTAFAKQELEDIAAKLMNVAKVLSQTKKELMPLVQKMAEAGSMLTNELSTSAVPEEGAPDAAGAPPQANNPGDVGLGA